MALRVWIATNFLPIVTNLLPTEKIFARLLLTRCLNTRIIAILQMIKGVVMEFFIGIFTGIIWFFACGFVFYLVRRAHIDDTRVRRLLRGKGEGRWDC